MLQLQVGERVVYPNQGLCTVTDIKIEEIAGQKLTFVSLVFSETGAKVKVPAEKLAKNGVRRVANADDAKAVLDYLRSQTPAPSTNWKIRAKENGDLLAKGALVDLAKVLKNHYDVAGLHALPPKEREQYNDARDLLVAELAVALQVQEAEAEDLIDVVLFPVGKERPRLSPAEFGGAEDEELDLLMGGDDPLAEGGEAAEGEAEGGGEEAAEGEEGEAGEDGEAKPKAAAKPAEAPKKKPGRPPKKTIVSDEEVTQAATAALTDALLSPKKRGRPPKPKPEGAVEEAPKKRGRPPKPKPEGAAEEPPKKRGRPPKAK